MRAGIGELEDFDGRGRGGTSEDSEGGGTYGREIQGDFREEKIRRTHLGNEGLRDNLRGSEGNEMRRNQRAVRLTEPTTSAYQAVS